VTNTHKQCLKQTKIILLVTNNINITLLPVLNMFKFVKRSQ